MAVRTGDAPAPPSLPTPAEPRPSPDAGKRAGGRRAALDGVRGIAIALVVVHHFTQGLPAWLAGGFLGVDLFFVLSGYLITGLLVRAREHTGRIGLGNFWLRRARRLLPPLLAVVALLAALLRWAGMPEDWPYERADAVSALLYTANVHMAQGLDLWGRREHGSLLLHTWSLAVEEQFYLVWPLVLAALLALGARLRRPRTPVLLACAVAVGASFGWLALTYLGGAPAAGYLDTRGRAGELLAGAALALVLPVARRRVPGAAWTGLGALGLGGVVLGVATLQMTSGPYFLGGAAAVTLAACLLVAAVEAAPGSAVARLVAVLPLAALGRISYTLYLVHSPVAVLVGLPEDRSVAGIAVAELLRLALSLGLATLSYLVLERPLLRGTLPWLGRSRPRLALAGVTAVAAVVGIVLWGTSLPRDLDEQVLAAPSTACPGQTVDTLATCSLSDGPQRWVVAGDAQAAGLARALATQPGLAITQAGWLHCGAGGIAAFSKGSGAATVPPSPQVLCARQAPGLVTAALAAPGTAALVVADATSAGATLETASGTAPPGTAPHDDAVRDALLAMVDAAAEGGRPTVLLRQPPPSQGLGPLVAAGRPAGVAPALDGPAERMRRYDAVLAEVAARRPAWARVVSVDDLVCPGGRCPAVVDGLLVRHETQAFAPAFARRVAPELAARILAALTPPRRAG